MNEQSTNNRATRASPELLWQVISQTVAEATEKHPAFVQAELRSLQITNKEPEYLIRLMMKMNPAQAVEMMKRQNPNLNWNLLSSQRSEELSLTEQLEIVQATANLLNPIMETPEAVN